MDLLYQLHGLDDISDIDVCHALLLYKPSVWTNVPVRDKLLRHGDGKNPMPQGRKMARGVTATF
jgi:hypothetical protein